MQHHKSRTLDPKWGEVKYCLVQEPKTQNLRVEVHDFDVVNISVSWPPPDLCMLVSELLLAC